MTAVDEEGTVSLWVGHAQTEGAFEAVIEARFSDDGDFIGSQFSRAFGIGYYEDWSREAAFYGSSRRTLADLLKGASFEDVVVPRLEALAGTMPSNSNCVVLLYGYHHVEPQTADFAGVSLVFYGSVSHVAE